jgi:hypothetical protein
VETLVYTLGKNWFQLAHSFLPTFVGRKLAKAWGAANSPGHSRFFSQGVSGTFTSLPGCGARAGARNALQTAKLSTASVSTWFFHAARLPAQTGAAPELRRPCGPHKGVRYRAVSPMLLAQLPCENRSGRKQNAVLYYRIVFHSETKVTAASLHTTPFGKNF